MIKFFKKILKKVTQGKKAALERDTDILTVPKPDRRLLSKVPDPEGLRTNIDRRQFGDDDYETMAALIEAEKMSRRYVIDYDVTIICAFANKKTRTFYGRGIDLSGTGILLEVSSNVLEQLSQASRITLKFEIEPGTMPEGYEMSVNIKAEYIRSSSGSTGTSLCGLLFSETLAEYAVRKKNWYMLSVASLFLFLITLCVILMRTESVLYFKFNKILYSYSIIAASFLVTRYLFAVLYSPVPIDINYTPGVTIIIPCFNEEEFIQKTISSCINQDYPCDKLEVIVVDDCSSDQSLERTKEIVAKLKATEQRYNIEGRLHCVAMEKNSGKREALAKGAYMAKHDLIVFVDSDSFLDPYAIRNIVQPFKDDRMGGVCGRTDVANTYTNALTKMQAVRYYIAFRVMKAAESYFDAVTCLSGPLSCYRKDLLMKYMDAWLNQTFWGEKATLGDDRSITNFILRHHRTCYQDTAICSSVVPNTHALFLRQQMRWKRSWLRESMIAATFMWKKEPFMSLSFYMGVLVPLLAPIIVLYNLIYIPLIHRVFPVTFLLGLFLMAMLMSMAQLLLRKSSTWIYGLWFCVYYEVVLLWQMPIAWVTFGKTTWGTRMTWADVEALGEKSDKKQQGVAKNV